MKKLAAICSGTACLTTTLSAFQHFEGDGFGNWEESGNAFGKGPAFGEVSGVNGRFTGFTGKSFAVSGHGGDAATGALTSPVFKISEPYIHFLIAGGNHPGKTAVQLLVDGKIVREATGTNDLTFRPVTWEVNDLTGKQAQIRVLDDHTGRWGIIGVDHVIMNARAKPNFPGRNANATGNDELVPSPVIAGNMIPPGTSLKVFADRQSHGVTSPTAFAFDEQGGLYITETHRFRFGVEDDRNHRYWYLDDLAAQNNDDRLALHEKWQHKVSMEWMTAKSEVVRKLTDDNGDGKADRMTVFADGFNDVLDGTAAGIFAHEGTLYFASIPKIHILKDTTGDGVADQRDMVADGFGVRISLSGHDLNGFALGNDGRIYGTIGDRGFSTITREDKHYHYPDQGAIFRFEPGGANFEVIHTGLRNPKEIAFDEFGNGITVDNNSDQGDPCRIVYIMDGADSGWTMHHQALFTFREDIGLESPPPSPWMTERMSHTRNPEQPAFIVAPVGNLTNGPSGLTYHPGTGFLESERGRFLICDYKASPAASGIYSFRVSREGAGMKYEGARKFNWGVTPTDVEYSYDGRVFVADFIGGWTSHDDGRIYAISADSEENGGRTPDVAAIMAGGFAKRTTADLAGLLGHADQRIRMRAHIQLAATTAGTPPLIAATRNGELLTRLHGLWGLGIRARKDADGDATATLVALLADHDPEVRAQAAHVLGEVPSVGAARFIPLLADESTRVRSFAALAIARQETTPTGQATGPILRLLEENADQDTYLRHAGVVALQATCTEDQLAALATHPAPPVRLAAVVALRRAASPRLADFLADATPAVADEAIRAIHDVPVEAARPALAALLDSHLGGSAARPLPVMNARRLIHSTFRLGGTENASRLIRAAASPQLDLQHRLEAIRLLRQWADPFPVDQSLGRWDPLAPRDVSAIAATLEAGLEAVLASGDELLEPTLQLVADLGLGGDAFTEDALFRLANNDKLPGTARATALGLWVAKSPANPEATLRPLANDKSDEVAGKSVELLVRVNPANAAEAIRSALASSSATRRQSAWTALGHLPGPAAATLIANALNEAATGKGDATTRLELLEAAAMRDEPQVKTALLAYQSSLASDDPLAAYLPALAGGDADRGALIFRTHGTGQCIRCHGAGNDASGADAGPNLAGIGKAHDRRYLLESLVAPEAEIAPGFGVVALTLQNGGSIGGTLIDEADAHYDIAVGNDHWRVKKSDVKSATPPLSTMPPMGGILSQRELRDLVAYLASLDQPLGGQTKLPEPKPFDPATVAPGN